MIYLDNNATTPLAPEVVRVMERCLREDFGNPSSTHYPGRKARKAVEDARQQVSKLIGARPEEIIFTSGGTEANNMAILGTALRFKTGSIITSSIEHPSVLKPLEYLKNLGFEIIYLPVDKYGFVSPKTLKKQLRKDTILITIMHSNNETGVIQPIAEIGEIARDRGIVFHTDAAQSVGKVPINVKRLKTDLLTIVSHKFYGPKGVGALYKRTGVKLKPILYGASHEKGLRPGTENVACIVGFGKASEIARKEIKHRVKYMRYLSNKFYRLLRRQIRGLRLNGHPLRRLPNTLNLLFPGIEGLLLLDKFKNEIAASTGSACHEGIHQPSHVLKAMGLSDNEVLSSIRFSLGRNNTESEIERAASIIAKAYLNL